MSEPFGFINAFKPPGPSSTSFGTWARRLFGHRISGGHWGTLDPRASGVLVIAIGEATKLLPYLGEGQKRYVFELIAGARTTTGDGDGDVVDEAAVPTDWAERLRSALSRFVGDLDQMPPMFSAVKVGGRPLYRAARRGVDVERPSRRVRIAGLDVLRAGARHAVLRVTCSSGTYVRVLCEQLADASGTMGHMGMLLREAAGPFELSASTLPSQLAREPTACLVAPQAVLPHRTVTIDGEDARRFSHGNPIQADPSDESPDGSVVLVESAGVLLGIAHVARAAAGTRLVPSRVLVASEGRATVEANEGGA